MEPAVSERPNSRSSAFGQLLLRHRVFAGLSHEALAERARISVDAVSALERGARRRPRFDTVALLVAALALDGDGRRMFEAAARPPLPQIVAGPEPEPAGTPPTNLPVAFSRFVGRELEIEEIVGCVRRRSSKRVSCTRRRLHLARPAVTSTSSEPPTWI